MCINTYTVYVQYAKAKITPIQRLIGIEFNNWFYFFFSEAARWCHHRCVLVICYTIHRDIQYTQYCYQASLESQILWRTWARAGRARTKERGISWWCCVYRQTDGGRDKKRRTEGWKTGRKREDREVAGKTGKRRMTERLGEETVGHRALCGLCALEAWPLGMPIQVN